MNASASILININSSSTICAANFTDITPGKCCYWDQNHNEYQLFSNWIHFKKILLQIFRLVKMFDALVFVFSSILENSSDKKLSFIATIIAVNTLSFVVKYQLTISLVPKHYLLNILPSLKKKPQAFFAYAPNARRKKNRRSHRMYHQLCMVVTNIRQQIFTCCFFPFCRRWFENFLNDLTTT